MKKNHSEKRFKLKVAGQLLSQIFAKMTNKDKASYGENLPWNTKYARPPKQHKRRSNHKPHQGEKEKTRRLRQLDSGFIKLN